MRVLSIDGGGMRGLYTVQYLAALAERYAKVRRVQRLDIGAGFDLVVGTSTGAIIGCALAAGVDLSDVANFYRERGPFIFPAKLPKRLGPRLLWQLYRRPSFLRRGADVLESALLETFGDITVGTVWVDRRIALAIPVVEMSRHHAWVFKTPHLANSKHRDDDYKLAEVCLAATAAPIYRSMARIPNPDGQGRIHNVFVDGGLWANSPVLVGLVDALEMTMPGDRIEIYRLGTCPRPEGDLLNAREVHRGLIQWKLGGEVVTVSLDAQDYAFGHMARILGKHVDRDCRIIRFPHGPVPADLMKYLDLDETSQKAMDALEGQALKDASETLSRTGDQDDSDGSLLDALLREVPANGMV